MMTVNVKRTVMHYLLQVHKSIRKFTTLYQGHVEREFLILLKCCGDTKKTQFASSSEEQF
jgi:hypothetical protein